MTEQHCHYCGRLLARRLTPPRGEMYEIKCPRCGHANFFGRDAGLLVDGRPARAYTANKS